MGISKRALTALGQIVRLTDLHVVIGCAFWSLAAVSCKRHHECHPRAEIVIPLDSSTSFSRSIIFPTLVDPIFCWDSECALPRS